MKFLVEITEGIKHGNQQVVDHATEISHAVASKLGVHAHHVTVKKVEEPPAKEEAKGNTAPESTGGTPVNEESSEDHDTE